MALPSPAPAASGTPAPAGVFHPRTLVVTNGNQGSDAQAQGLLQTLGVSDAEFRHVRLKGLSAWLAPGGGAPLGHVGKKGKLFRPPWPDLVISVGRHAAPYALVIRKKAKGQTFAMALQDPKTKPEKWDMIWAPDHDGLEGENVVSTLLSPHRVTPERLAAPAAALEPQIAAMPRPRVAVLVGGPNGKFRFGASQARKLCAHLEALAPEGSFLITTSRRTPAPVTWTIQQWIGGRPARLWMGGENNPYLAFLGAADAVVVTADSVNMAGEAAGTGKPVYVFELPGHAPKFRRFHDALRATGATRPLSGQHFEPWTYAPLNDNEKIAAAVRAAYLAWEKARG
ncbi:MAG: mitochondrial fission ELM1 family protein [Hyphomonadaceae bacterium]